MIWNDDSGTQPKHHAGRPQGKPDRGCLRDALLLALIVIVVLIIKEMGG